MSIDLSLLLTNILGIYIFLFLFWRELHEDMPRNALFGISTSLVISAVIGGLVAYFSDHTLWFWSAFFLFSMTSVLHIFFKKSLTIYEFLDAVLPGVYIWFGLVCLTLALYSYTPLKLIFGLLPFLVLLVFSYIKSKYRKFTWYKSGKIGIAGLLSLGTYFFVRSLIAIFVPNMISLVGSFDAALSLSVSFLCYFYLYHLTFDYS